jgi:hypothetical protein
MDKEFAQNCVKKYNCHSCNYTTQRHFDLERHKMSALHKKITNYEKNCGVCVKTGKSKNKETIKEHACICGKTYRYIQGLYKHKKKCTNKSLEDEHKQTNTIASLVPQDYNFMVDLIKQNNELQKQIIEMSKEPKIVNNYNTNSGNNTTTNNHNQFNINLFLNETCKNAINFSEFIDNIQVSYDDLENNAKMGFVSGMTKIIVDNLKRLELNDRPIHCTDVKRETIYVKEEDQWEKDNSKEVIQKGIQEITCKNMNQLMEWREENPEYNDMDSDLSELSIVMQQQSMAGGKREEYYPKIIKNMAKETVIDKSTVLKIPLI